MVQQDDDVATEITFAWSGQQTVMLVTVTRRKSGKSISTPTNYLRDGDTLWVISWRNRR